MLSTPAAAAPVFRPLWTSTPSDLRVKLGLDAAPDALTLCIDDVGVALAP